MMIASGRRFGGDDEQISVGSNQIVRALHGQDRRLLVEIEFGDLDDGERRHQRFQLFGPLGRGGVF